MEYQGMMQYDGRSQLEDHRDYVYGLMAFLLGSEIMNV